jgi:hypothetical protein
VILIELVGYRKHQRLIHEKSGFWERFSVPFYFSQVADPYTIMCFANDPDPIIPLLRRMQSILWHHGHLDHALKFHDYIAWFERHAAADAAGHGTGT